LNYLIIVCLSFVTVSCSPSNKQETGSVNNNSDAYTIVKDTLITYNIEGISTEGTGAVVNYVNGKITKSIIYIYAGTWQASIIYEFEKNRIKVLETKYSYKTELENVTSDEDMQLDYETSYFIDFKGKVIGLPIQERIDIFQEFKATVPFDLIL